MTESGPFEPATVRGWRGPLLRWYRKNRRDLPWRRTGDPYAIWVSEVMLQQTTVAAVVPFWVRFVDRLPTIEALAAASEETVLGLWSGLGYYRRARALREGARFVRDRLGGRLPPEPERLREIPGIGAYTAGAISSLAFGRAAPVVDGNVRRVFSRLLARDGGKGDALFWNVAATLVRGDDPGDLNQALMELGATVCTPHAPRCTSCPLRGACAAFAAGLQGSFPARRAAAPVRRIRVAIAVAVDGGCLLVERRREGAPLRGAWDVPARVLDDGADAARVLSHALSRDHGLRVRAGRVAGRVRHAILDTRLALEIVAFDVPSVARGDATRWIPLEDLAESPVSGATRKAVGVALQSLSHGGVHASPGGRAPAGGSASRGRGRVNE